MLQSRFYLPEPDKKKLKKLQLDFTKFSLQLVEKLTQYAVLKYEEQEDFQKKL